MKIFFICVCVLIIFSGTTSAKQLSVNKIVPNMDIKTGDSVAIALEFNNPFNVSIPITIQDNNILGSNGLDIQCYEYILPDKPGMTLSYDFPIQAFSAGDFTLDPASVTYTNPDTGAQETVRSQPMPISIKQGASSGQQQGVTTIYNCKGVSMRSTSYSSTGGTSISISSGQQQTNRPSQPAQDKVQQAASDMQNLKDEMNSQQQNYQNMQNELRNRVENNSEFKNMKEELEKKGYSQQQADIKPESGDSGTFEYGFTKDNDTSTISGRMNNSRMESINKQSSEDIRKLQEFIESNSTFQQMQRRLSDKGFNLSEKGIDFKPNISSFDYRFSDQHGRNASISGNITNNGTINDISLKEPEEPLPYWMLIFLILPLIGIYLYRKYGNKKNKNIIPDDVPLHVKVDHRKEALARLDNAVKMFQDGMKKEAYSEASIAVRIYLKGRLGISEFTSEEILKEVRGSGDQGYLEDIEHCLALCDLVKFAKYEPDPEDFNKAVGYAKRVLMNESS